MAPAGLVVTWADSATLPRKPPLGVTVIVVLLPLVAPAANDSEPVGLSVRPGTGAVVTVCVAEAAVAVMFASPEYVAPIASVPRARVDVVHVALPVAATIGSAVQPLIALPLAVKLTVPDGSTGVSVPESAAVNVTA
jgi:hypothetical protein